MSGRALGDESLLLVTRQLSCLDLHETLAVLSARKAGARAFFRDFEGEGHPLFN